MDYSRRGELFTVAWNRHLDPGLVVAEHLTESGADLRVIATADLSRASLGV